MRPTCRIKQPKGLGDICFIQKLVDRVIGDGYDVELPVVMPYLFLGQYIQKPHLTFLADLGHGPERPVDMQLPLADAGTYYPHMPVLAAKYQMLRMNYDNWQDHFTFTRYPTREQELMNRLGCHELLAKGGYEVVSKSIRTPPESIKVDFELANSGLPVIEVSPDYGYNPFDWSGVFEKATRITIVDSCFTFILEKLNLCAEKLVLVSRSHMEGGVHESLMTLHMFKQPWTLLPPKS